MHVLADVRPVYTIDAQDRLVFANAAFKAFHRDHVDVEPLLGGPVWALVPDGQIRQLWELLYGRVRAVGSSMFVPMRADTAVERRLIDIELLPQHDGSIRHTCDRVWTEARAAVALLDPAYPRDERTLRCCYWCKRIQVRLGSWQEIEDAQLILSIEAAETLPVLAPSVCSTCKQSLLKSFPARVA
jgi:hypothetical protein